MTLKISLTIVLKSRRSADRPRGWFGRLRDRVRRPLTSKSESTLGSEDEAFLASPYYLPPPYFMTSLQPEPLGDDVLLAPSDGGYEERTSNGMFFEQKSNPGDEMEIEHIVQQQEHQSGIDCTVRRRSKLTY